MESALASLLCIFLTSAGGGDAIDLKKKKSRTLSKIKTFVRANNLRCLQKMKPYTDVLIFGSQGES